MALQQYATNLVTLACINAFGLVQLLCKLNALYKNKNKKKC